MLSPATFIGIAKAIAPAGSPAPTRPVPTHPALADATIGSPPAGPASTGSTPIQRARVLSTPPIGPTPAPLAGPKPPVTAASPNPQTAPPRNLPRGSLLDLSV